MNPTRFAHPLRPLAAQLWRGLAISVALTAAPASAVTVVAEDAGFVTSAGGSSKGDGTVVAGATYNYSAGWEVHYTSGALGTPPGTTPLAPMVRKSYFVFDLTSITTPIASASLVINAGTYESSDPSESLDFFAPGDVAAAVLDSAFLLAEHGFGSVAFDEATDLAIGVAMAHFGNLTAGPAVGFVSVSGADDDDDLVVFIDPGFLNAFLGSKVVIGGSLTSLTTTATPEAIMGFTGPDISGGDPLTPKLELTLVPEPDVAALVLAGGWAFVLRRRRSPRRAG